jgi:hypothetical protein
MLVAGSNQHIITYKAHKDEEIFLFRTLLSQYRQVPVIQYIDSSRTIRLIGPFKLNTALITRLKASSGKTTPIILSHLKISGSKT